MKKLYPSWKVYQGWMGCDPSTAPIALWEVTVNRAYHMSNFSYSGQTVEEITMERLISDLEKHSGKAGRVSRQGTIIPKYDVLAVCNACGDAHPTGISINLAGPVKKRSIATAYRGKNLPRHLATLKQERVYCPNLGRHYPQTDYRQIFLVPSAERAANRGS
jgi:hypothetical protein